MKTVSDIVGNKYGRLTVTAFAGYSQHARPRPQWLCKCTCGNEYVGVGSALKNGNTSSCGCLRKEVSTANATTHGMKGTSVYNTWSGMINRCSLPSNNRYARYGGRGISVCKRWLSFENFLEDMGEPKKGESIDRVNNNGNYEPSNCRWANDATQRRNKSNNIWIKVGNESMIITDWAKRLGCGINTIKRRIARGWDIVDAVTRPVNFKGVTL